MFRVRSQLSTLRPGALLALAAGLTLLTVLGANPVLAKDGEPRLLILPFVVHSAEAPEYVRGGLSDMLNSRFERIGGLDLIREDDPEKGTSSLAKALERAREVDADYVVFGSFTRFGKGASLDVQCAPAAGGGTREPLREIFVHSGSIGEIIPDLDELAGKVSRFARGEDVRAAPAPAAVASNARPAVESGGIDSEELADLRNRVAALEATIVELLDADAVDVEEP